MCFGVKCGLGKGSFRCDMSDAGRLARPSAAHVVSVAALRKAGGWVCAVSNDSGMMICQDNELKINFKN